MGQTKMAFIIRHSIMFLPAPDRNVPWIHIFACVLVVNAFMLPCNVLQMFQSHKELVSLPSSDQAHT